MMEKLFEIRTSPIHGTGAFALSRIPAETRIVEYTGEIITKEESARRCQAMNPFIFHIDEVRDLDGNQDGNPARFFNHSCEPNCESQMDDGKIWVYSRRTIEPEEELTFNYGYDLENYEEHICKCGSKTCIGYILAEDYFPQFRKEGVRPPVFE
jgi:SET domain-containing protein